MEARESINDSSKLIAQAIELLNKPVNSYDQFTDNVDEAIPLLEQALEKLTNNM